MVYKNLIIAIVFLVFGLLVYLLSEKLSKGNHSDGEKKTLTDYHGELSLVGVFFMILSFVSFGYWVWLNFFLAKQ